MPAKDRAGLNAFVGSLRLQDPNSVSYPRKPLREGWGQDIKRVSTLSCQRIFTVTLRNHGRSRRIFNIDRHDKEKR